MADHVCGCGESFPDRESLVDHMNREHVRSKR